jgi:anthranilate phosphoribosyltransferase
MARIAAALARLGVDRALVVSSEDGLDEISAGAPTKVVEVNGEEVREYVLEPRDVGVAPDVDPSAADGSRGGTPQENALVTRAILEGAPASGERPAGESLAVINAGAAIYAAGRAETIAEGVQAAREALADGRAADALERYLQASRRHAPAEVAR